MNNQLRTRPTANKQIFLSTALQKALNMPATNSVGQNIAGSPSPGVRAEQATRLSLL